MAGHPRLVYAHKQRIAVAVVGYFPDLLHIAGNLTLLPELLAAAAVIPGIARFQCLPQGLLIHVSEHQHLAAFFLHDCGHQTLFIKFYHGNINLCCVHQSLTSTPRDFKYSFTCLMVN